MTTVAANLHEMAADTQITADGCQNVHSDKVWRIGQSIFGGAGDYAEILRFVEWKRKGGKAKYPTFERHFEMLELAQDGLFSWDVNFKRLPLKESFHSIGSGALGALTAMGMGATPARAVELCSCFDNHTGGPVTVLKLKARRGNTTA